MCQGEQLAHLPLSPIPSTKIHKNFKLFITSNLLQPSYPNIPRQTLIPSYQNINLIVIEMVTH